MYGLLHPSEFFLANIKEIRENEILRKYGFFLSLIHIYTFLFWFLNSKIYNFIGADAQAICQPFFQNCRDFRFMNAESWRWALVGYFVLAVIGCVLWLTRFVTSAYLYFLFLILVKLLFYVQDYRLMGNYHYIFFLISFVYAFLPRKVTVLPIFIVLIYLAAGSLKFNYEWLSGAALYGQLGILSFFPLELATAYVLVLEMAVSLLLLSKNNKIRVLALGQFVLFHLYSVQIVGLYYPLVMFSILSIFVLMIQRKSFPSYQDIFSWREAFVYIALGFVLCQAYPKLFFPRSAVTGEGRLISLNMFDAQASCRHSFNLQSPVGGYTLFNDLSQIGVRIKCDPYLYRELAINICSTLKQEKSTAKLNLFLQSRKFSEPAFKVIVDERDICSKALTYNPMARNSWIRD